MRAEKLPCPVNPDDLPDPTLDKDFVQVSLVNGASASVRLPDSNLNPVGTLRQAAEAASAPASQILGLAGARDDLTAVTTPRALTLSSRPACSDVV